MTSRIVSVPDGEELSEALASAVRGIDAWVYAAGFVDGAELRVAGDGVDPMRRVAGRHAIAALGGPAGGPYGIVLARSDGDPVAGHLVRAKAVGVTLHIVQIGAQAAPVDAPPLAEPKPGTKPPPNAWAAIATATATAAVASRDPEPPASVPPPSRGDRVLHFAFGMCDVVSVRGDRLHIRDLSGPGRVREISLEKLAVQPPYEKDGKRVFRLSRKQEP